MPHPPTTPTTIPHGPPRAGVPVAVVENTHYQVVRSRQIGKGSRLGRYLLDGELGHGGMGVVYSAIDVKLGRRAAVKVMRPAQPNFRALSHGSQRLLREAQALARIDHPNIVSLYDVGEAGGGVYLAMEELHGVSLKAWLASERRGWIEVLGVFVQAGRGLAAAHRAGVMHRDFKPHNVQVEDDGRVVVLDFGLALSTETGPGPSESGAEIILHNRFTDVGIVLGTAGYMAPEQLMHSTSGPQSDQFAYCVALYEGLFGMRPYEGSTALEIARSFRGGAIHPPERNRVPGRLRRALLRGLSIDPRKRWPSMDDLLAELERDPHQRLRGVSRTAALVAGAWVGAYGVMWAQSVVAARAAVATCAEPSRSAPLHLPH